MPSENRPFIVRTLAATAVLALAGSAAPGAVDVIFSRAPGSATADVPGAVDTSGNPVSAQFNTMLEFWLSPDGTRWLLRGATNQPTSESDSYLLLGSGLTGSVVLQEGRPFPGAVGSEVVDFFTSSEGYPFNANNDWAFALRAKGGVASVFQKILRFSSAGAGTLRYQMGDLYTGLTDNPVGNAGNETIGNSASSIQLLNNGTIGWYDPNPGNLSSTRYPVSAYDAARYLQSNADTVTRIDGSGPIGISSISSTGTISVFLTSPDGTRRVIRGKADVDGNLSSLSDPDIVVVDGQIRAQVGQPLPGDPSLTVAALNQTFVAANNDWYIRGTTSSGAWAVRNGTVIVKSGDAVGSDTWGTATFYTISGNSAGSWLLAGKTTNANPAVDDVIVVNGQVVLREGDPVMLDVGGTPTTAYIGRGNNTLAAFPANNSAGLAPNGTVYALVYLHDAGGADLAPSLTPYALVRITPTTPVCAPDFNHSGDLSVQDIFDFLGAWFAGNSSADYNHDGHLEVQDIFDFLAGWFAGC